MRRNWTPCREAHSEGVGTWWCLRKTAASGRPPARRPGRAVVNRPLDRMRIASDRRVDAIRSGMRGLGLSALPGRYSVRTYTARARLSGKVRKTDIASGQITARSDRETGSWADRRRMVVGSVIKLLPAGGLASKLATCRPSICRPVRPTDV